MSFCSYSKETQNLSKTMLDNVFISNYLPDAPENAVKVYVYGLYLCQNSNDITIENLAESLSLSVIEVKDFFNIE
ncbi:MAG: hypothetical protein J6Q58_01325 [Clostridia bacterium]|nr:hypothetical protein [Clostridia bacterium]